MAVDRFVALVREYLDLVDSAAEYRPHEFLQRCARILPEIYALGCDLPSVEVPELAPESPQAREPGYPMPELMRLLGKHDAYAEVFDPVYDRDALMASLSDDLADVYWDLRRPLERYDSGSEPDLRVAVWEWRFNLQTHAGDHLVDALRPIHRLIFDHMDPEYESA